MRERYRQEWNAEMQCLPATGFTSLLFAIRVLTRSPSTARVLRGESTVTQAVFDRGLAAVALILLGPALSGFAIAVRLSGSRPVLARRVREGAKGSTFDVLMFRTVDAEGKPTRVGRIIGRLSYDQFPRSVNLLRGEMAFVGPPARHPSKGWPPDHPFRAHLDAGGKPGLVSWTTYALITKRWTMEEALHRDVALLGRWRLVAALRVLMMAPLVLVARQDLPGEDASDRPLG
jgi:lipopolysaccharide/colanic/teichoic acid biosynthesis glycosyltransferase